MKKRKIWLRTLLNDKCLHQLWLHLSVLQHRQLSLFSFPPASDEETSPAHLSYISVMPSGGSAAATAPSNRPCQSMASLKNQFWPTFQYAKHPASRNCSSFVDHVQRRSWKCLIFVHSVTLDEIPPVLCTGFCFLNWKHIKAKPIPPLLKCWKRNSSQVKPLDGLLAQNQQAHTWTDPQNRNTQNDTFDTTLANGKSPSCAAASPSAALPLGSCGQSRRKQRTIPVYATPTLS